MNYVKQMVLVWIIIIIAKIEDSILQHDDDDAILVMVYENSAFFCKPGNKSHPKKSKYISKLF